LDIFLEMAVHTPAVYVEALAPVLEGLFEKRTSWFDRILLRAFVSIASNLVSWRKIMSYFFANLAKVLLM
jgi:hypothetical protein